MEYFIINCPHCNEFIIIFENELNCKIFRHGVLKSNLQQIDQHLNKEDCDYLFNNNLIYGCGKPFKIEKNIDKYQVEICDYI